MAFQLRPAANRDGHDEEPIGGLSKQDNGPGPRGTKPEVAPGGLPSHSRPGARPALFCSGRCCAIGHWPQSGAHRSCAEEAWRLVALAQWAFGYSDMESPVGTQKNEEASSGIDSGKDPPPYGTSQKVRRIYQTNRTMV